MQLFVKIRSHFHRYHTCITVILAGCTAVLIGCVAILALSWRGVVEYYDSTDELFVNSLDSIVPSLAAEHEYYNIPYDAMHFGFLVNSRMHLDIVNQRANAGTHAELRSARVFLTRAKISRELGNVGETEADLVQAKNLLLSATEEARTQEFVHLAVQIESRLGSLYARTSRYSDAYECFATAIQLLQSREAGSVAEILPANLLATLHRNQGIVMEMQGENGSQAVGTAIRLLERIPNEPFQDLERRELLLDSLQLATQLDMKHGKLDVAERRARESTSCAEELKSYAATLAKDGIARLPHHRYRNAARMAQENLATILKAASEKSTKFVYLPWMPLVNYGATTLQADMLIQGRLPAEFETQDGILLAWNSDDWDRTTKIQMIQALQDRLRVVLFVQNDMQLEEARVVLLHSGVNVDRIEFVQVETDSVWIRDYGPQSLEVAPGEFVWLDNQGGEDSNGVRRFRDNIAPKILGAQQGVPVMDAPMYLEGGGLLSNGDGLFLVSQPLLDNSRGLGFSEDHFRDSLSRVLGAQQIVVLKGLVGEATGHVDLFATFVAEDLLVLGEYDATVDAENARILDEYEQQLAGLETSSGPLRVVRVPMPPRVGGRFGGSYTNVVLANGTLLMPSWQHAPAEMEARALGIYRRLLPDWEIVPIDCSEVGTHGGALHCLSMNLFGLDAQKSWAPPRTSPADPS